MSKIVPQDEEIVEQIKLLRDAVPPIIGYKKVEGTSPPCPCPCPCSPENNDVTFDLTPFSTFIFQRVFRGSSRGGTLV